jgi:hypothetical protein
VTVLAALSGCEMFGSGDGTDNTDPRPDPNTGPLSGTATRQEYVDLFNAVKTLHEHLGRTMNDRASVNTLRANSLLSDMRTHTKRMAMMTAEPYSSQLMGIAGEFEKTREAVTKGTWSQRHLADLDAVMRRFSRDFANDRVTMRENTLPDTTGSTNPKTGTTPTAGTDPATGKVDPDKLRDAPWVLFGSWEKEHRDLLTAVSASDEAATRTHYTRVMWLLKEFDACLAETERPRLARFRSEYEDAERRTQTFTRYSEDFNKEAAVKSLTMAGDGITLNFDPDRK